MKLGERHLLVCNCERTMSLDGKKLCAALGGDGELHVHSNLCRSELGAYERALESGEKQLVACTQEAPLFSELAEEREKSELVAFTNIRERAGWSKDGAAALPKIAALLAEAAIEVEPAGLTALTSQGVCLVYGAGQTALDTARELAKRLDVTLLLSDGEDVMPPAIVDVPIFRGRIVQASGHFGAFEVTVDGYAPMVPSSRETLDFVMARDGARSSCDLIFDMSGGTPLLPAHAKRDGYFRVDPDHPAGIAQAMFEAADMVGTFEKPLYVAYDPEICAHGRSGKVGCSRCLDACPASAITPAGDLVAIDPGICGGCGSCASVCPTGAASYTYPRRRDVVRRAQVLLSRYREAGGADPVILVHDERHGLELISASARLGRGLPANVIPFALNEVTSLGHEAMAAMLAGGAHRIVLLAPPGRRDELDGLGAQAALTDAVVAAMGYGGERVRLLVEQDPDALEEALWQGPDGDGVGLPASLFTPTGDKRAVARTAFTALNDAAPERQEIIALPEAAPYGRIHIDTDGCTLCLACVGACPAGALQDNPDRPQVRFIEQACVQCGLCRATCPENVISLEPRLNLMPDAMNAHVLNEEEPFECIRCGTPFGTRSTVEHVLAKLGGTHSMFRSQEAARLIQMCDTCRIETQAESTNDPFAAGPRPRVRTTEDYLAAEEAAANGRSGGALRPEDFLVDDD